MQTKVKIAHHSERGRRKQNEDMYAIPAILQERPLPERGLAITPEKRATYARKGYLLLVADGVGGHDGGEEASAQALQEIAQR